MDSLLLTSGMELLLKSLLILGTFGLVGLFARTLLPARQRHLIWLNALFILLLLPFSPRISLPGAESVPALFTVSVGAVNQESELTPFLGYQAVAIGFYALIASLLLLRVLLACYRVQRIRREARPVTDEGALALMKRSAASMGVKREVALATSEQIGAPVSCGFLRPLILLPARGMSQDLLQDVLLHELAHIRRLDWPVMMMAQAIACVFWINPLVWLVLSRLNLEAENSCDEAVVHSGRAGADYARSLVEVARRCRTHSRPVLHMQAVVTESTLKCRIQSILENRTMKKTSLRNTVTLLSVLSLSVLGLAGNFTLFGSALGGQAQAQQPEVVEPMIPLNTITPQYPTVAAEQGIEGWVHVRFDVNAEGTVEAGSISVVEAEPAELFNASAIRATAQFGFSPRRVNGQAVEVRGVQYVFRYLLDDEGEPTWGRNPPASR